MIECVPSYSRYLALSFICLLKAIKPNKRQLAIRTQINWHHRGLTQDVWGVEKIVPARRCATSRERRKGLQIPAGSTKCTFQTNSCQINSFKIYPTKMHHNMPTHVLNNYARFHGHPPPDFWDIAIHTCTCQPKMFIMEETENTLTPHLQKQTGALSATTGPILKLYTPFCSVLIQI